jgi:hypothetical protein
LDTELWVSDIMNETEDFLDIVTWRYIDNNAGRFAVYVKSIRYHKANGRHTYPDFAI